MTFVTNLTLRWGDLDSQSHVNNAAFLRLLQEGRVRLLQELGIASLLDDGVVVTEHQVEYLSPVRLTPEPLRLELWLTAVRGSSFTIAYLATHEGQTKLQARTTCCAHDVHAADPAPRRLSVAERSALTALVRPTEPLREMGYAEVGERGYGYGFRVRWSDEDRYGHVNNAVYFDYLQESRIALTLGADAIGSPVGGGGAEHMWFIARQDVKYLVPMTYRAESYEVRTGVVRFGNTSLTLAADIRDTDVRYARAATVLVCADTAGVPVTVPQRLRDGLAAHVLS